MLVESLHGDTAANTIYIVVRQISNDEDDENIIYEKMSVVLDRAQEAGGWYGISLSKTFLNVPDLEETIKPGAR